MIIPEDHAIVKLRKDVPWKEITAICDRAYQGREMKWVGAEKIDPRIMAGIVVYQSIYMRKQLREIASDFSYHVFVQYLCWFDELQILSIDHSTIVKFEKQLWEENLREIVDLIEKNSVKKQPPRSKGTSVIDSTAIEANIEYPTDIKILEDIRKFCVELIHEYQHEVWSKCRTYSKTAKENFLSNQKLRKASKEQRQEFTKTHIGFVNRNINQASTILTLLQIKVEKKEITLTKKLKRDLKKYEEKLKIARQILDQQKRLLKNWKLKNKEGRIVSFFRPNIRPIFRWKQGKKIEFGMKTTLLLIGNALILGKTSYDNFHDGKALEESITNFEQKGYKDETRIWDKWFTGCSKLMKQNNITDAIEKQGRCKNRVKNVSKKIFTRERSKIEGAIGTLKKMFFWNNKSRAKTDEGDARSLLLSCMGYNLRYSSWYGF